MKILFRAWHRIEKYMIIPFPIWKVPPLIVVNKSDWHIMQFTGLFDKKRKMIFEGDIVRRKVERNDYYPEQLENIISMSPEVRFGSELICGKLCTFEEIEKRQIASGWDYEIIGNIYEGVK